MDKAAKRLAVIYVILLSLCAPLMAVILNLFTWFMGVVDMSYWTQTVLWFLPAACVWRNPGNTWHLEHGQVIPDIQKAGTMLGCINGMLDP